MTAAMSTVPVHRFDPTACGFPRPRVPVLPTMRSACLNWTANDLRREVRHFARGRYALLAAYRLAGVGPTGALLAPAYHCRTMFDPALRLGADVGFYPLTAALAPDLERLRQVLLSSREPVKAMLLTHFFGFAQDTAAVGQLCAEHGVTLIEDCSHALAPIDAAPGNTARGIGTTGRYAVASPYKFFPCPDGGLLWRNDPAAPLPAQPGSPGAKAELRALLQVFRQWRTAPGALNAHAVDAELQAPAARASHPGRQWTDAQAGPSAEYQGADETIGSTATSRWLMRHAHIGHISAMRRARYAQWAEAVAGLRGVRALWPALPVGCTPYMFPLLVERADACFYPLKHLGMPLWRWDEMAASGCAVAHSYRLNLFHLPCHQALSDAEMAWMTSAVARVVGKT